MNNGNAYCRVYDALKTGIQDCDSVAAECRVTRANGQNVLTELGSLGLANISGWRLNDRLRLVSLWSFGPGDPVARPSMRDGHLTSETVTGKFIMEVLKRPMVVAEVAELVGSDIPYIGLSLKRMAEDPLSPVYVESWIRSIETGGASKPVYNQAAEPSKKRNVPRLAPMTEKHWKAARIKRVRAEFSDSGYGEDTVKRVVRAMFRSRNDGGAMSIVIEGKTVYQRREQKTAGVT